MTEVAVQVVLAVEIQHREGAARHYQWRRERKAQLEDGERKRKIEAECAERERQQRLEQAPIDRLLKEAAAFQQAGEIRKYIELLRARQAHRIDPSVGDAFLSSMKNEDGAWTLGNRDRPTFANRQMDHASGTAFGTARRIQPALSFDSYWLFGLNPSNPSLGGNLGGWPSARMRLLLMWATLKRATGPVGDSFPQKVCRAHVNPREIAAMASVKQYKASSACFRGVGRDLGKTRLHAGKPLISQRKLAHPTGFEPVTSAFGGQRSIHLSYGCQPARGRDRDADRYASAS